MRDTSMRTKLTEKFVNQLPHEERQYVVRDSAVTGFMVVVNKASKSYAVQRDLWRGERGNRTLVKTVRHTIAPVAGLRLEDARTEALEVIAQIKRGIDPNNPDSSAQAAEGSDAAAWTLKQLWQEYSKDLRIRGSAERTITEFDRILERYFDDWQDRQLTGIPRSDCRKLHQMITTSSGPAAANAAFRHFRAAFNFALKTVDDPDTLPDNPVKAVTFNKLSSRDVVILEEDLPAWWQAVHALDNPIRREMHILGLLSGLRRSNLTSLEWTWTDWTKCAVSVPRTKGQRRFDLPLSAPMVECLRRCKKAVDVLYPASPWVFPARSKKKELIHTQVVREKTLPDQTGHVLRHTYRTLAQAAGVYKDDVKLLLDQKVTGIDGVYLHDRALFRHLIKQQEIISEYILTLCGPKQRAAAE